MTKTANYISHLEKTGRESIFPLPTAYLRENGFSVMLNTKIGREEYRIEPHS